MIIKVILIINHTPIMSKIIAQIGNLLLLGSLSSGPLLFWPSSFPLGFVSFTLIFYGIMFILVENYNKRRQPRVTKLEKLDYKTALIIGFFQVLSLVPGTSRSGATIIGGILFGASRYVATEFTFFLAIPVMFGASLLKIVKFGWDYTGTELVILAVGMVTAFVVSVLSIKFLLQYIKKNDFKAFGWYRIALGILVLAYFFLVGDPVH